MSKAKCKQCGQTMSHVDFDQHDCPALVPQNAGEPWGAYMKRSDKAANEWRKAQNRSAFFKAQGLRLV